MSEPPYKRQRRKKKRSPNNIEKRGKTFDPVALGRLGGLKGGVARAEKLSPERRAEIAKKAALTRWSKVS